MRAAIVESDIQQLVDAARDAHNAMREATARHERAAKNLELAVQQVRRHKLELGRVLGKVRTRWPERGPKAKGWGEFLRAAGIDMDVARDAMEYAGFVEERFPGTESAVPENLPSRREAGLDDRPLAYTGPRLVEDPPSEPESDIKPDDAIEEPAPDRDTWCTPSWITEAIGKFDLDPCSNERSTVRSAFAYNLANGENGLALASEVPDRFSVFINPPYSDVMPWVQAYKRTRFCFLLKFDNSTKWFEELISHTAVVLFPRRTRIEFVAPPGVESSSNPFPHALFYAREDDVTAAIRKLCFEFWRKR